MCSPNDPTAGPGPAGLAAGGNMEGDERRGRRPPPPPRARPPSPGGATGGWMSDGSDGPTTKATAGWSPDPITPARRRYWTGSSWTYATSDAVAVAHQPPFEILPLPDGHRLPD